jgi:hypothetical protein
METERLRGCNHVALVQIKTWLPTGKFLHVSPFTVQTYHHVKEDKGGGFELNIFLENPVSALGRTGRTPSNFNCQPLGPNNSCASLP